MSTTTPHPRAGEPTSAVVAPPPGSSDTPQVRGQQGPSKDKDSTPMIAGAAGGAALVVILGGLFFVWRKKRRPSQRGRTIPVDDNLSYHSLDNGLEFDNVGYDQFMTGHSERQASERDSGLGDLDTGSAQPKFTETDA
ncbi:hypothetical protein EGW08_016247 [Elysia chlorotica]|uniref:Uncharacterized protein n=1 Tax=Elysia chlorotica TaxID=188477 RepID=A0A3S1B4Q7_ELYCH|nr:hypothetical protein EGW08_016247 [Elysia chlorotica]